MIILGFPGVGKSTLAQKEGYQDSDSSLFSWAPTSRTRHPEWPDNYLDHLEEAAKLLGGSLSPWSTPPLR